MNTKLAALFSICLLLLVGSAISSGVGGFTPQVATAYTSETVKTSPLGSTETPNSPNTPEGTGFTYQGRLKNGGSPASGQYDFSFSLFDAAAGGSPVGIGIIEPNVTVQDGLFTVVLNFGTSAFNGEARWLQIAVRPADTGNYTTLTPRQPITPAPYALFALKTKGYENVKVVAKSGGDFTSIQDALDSITGNGPANRYLVWVAPGTYTETVEMLPWVDIEGSGERQTIITTPGYFTDTVGTVIGANGAELRSLSVVNTGGAAYSIGIRNYSASPSLRNVTVTAGQGTTRNIGVYNYFSSPSMAGVTIDVDGPDNSQNHGVYNDNYSGPNMTDMRILVSGWTNAHNYGVQNRYYSSPTMTDVHIEVSGGDGTNATSSSTAIYNELYSSPTITDLTADVTGSTVNSYATGILSIDGSSLTMKGGIITSREASQNYGLQISGAPGSFIDMSGVAVTASGPANSGNYAANIGSIVFNASDVRFTASGGFQAFALTSSYDASVTLNGAVLRASGASNNNRALYAVGGSATVHASDIAAEGQSGTRYGVYLYHLNLYSSHVTLDSTKVKGATNSIYQSGDSLDYVRVAASKLEGGPVFISGGSGPVTCAGVHDENYAFFTNSCP